MLQGPITLFDGGEYAGDARIEDIAPGSTRLISYALDLETEIAIEEKPIEQVTVALQIRKGGLHVKHKATRRTHYVMKNSSGRAKQILVERPIDPAWNLVEPAVAETTRSLTRFNVKAEPGKPATLVVIVERDVAEDFVLMTLASSQWELYLHMQAASPALKTALQEALDRKLAAADIQTRRIAVEGRITELWADQDRVRKNLQAVPAVRADDPAAEEDRKASRELLQRYLTKLAELENEVERQRALLAMLKDEEAGANRALETFLQELVVD